MFQRSTQCVEVKKPRDFERLELFEIDVVVVFASRTYTTNNMRALVGTVATLTAQWMTVATLKSHSTEL